jgi:hypothetical protein
MDFCDFSVTDNDTTNQNTFEAIDIEITTCLIRVKHKSKFHAIISLYIVKLLNHLNRINNPNVIKHLEIDLDIRNRNSKDKKS